MAKKPRKREQTLEGMLESILELMGWQAELVRAALRQARQEPDQKRRPKNPPGK